MAYFIDEYNWAHIIAKLRLDTNETHFRPKLIIDKEEGYDRFRIQKRQISVKF